jgi:glycosyl-4,4'-diaponeurosporenoate acyltransferase
MPLVRLSRPWTATLDVVAWGAVHAGSGYLVHRLPLGWLARDGWLFTGRRWERGGRCYARRLRIRRWKDRLPEAGALFPGGVSKRRVPPAAAGGLERFVIETRRAELGHWLAAAPGPVFALWNPPGVALLMVAYGLAVNLPFIAVQRYNRLRVERVLRRRSARASGSTPPRAPARARSARGTTGSSMP